MPASVLKFYRRYNIVFQTSANELTSESGVNDTLREFDLSGWDSDEIRSLEGFIEKLSVSSFWGGFDGAEDKLVMCWTFTSEARKTPSPWLPSDSIWSQGARTSFVAVTDGNPKSNRDSGSNLSIMAFPLLDSESSILLLLSLPVSNELAEGRIVDVTLEALLLLRNPEVVQFGSSMACDVLVDIPATGIKNTYSLRNEIFKMSLRITNCWNFSWNSKTYIYCLEENCLDKDFWKQCIKNILLR